MIVFLDFEASSLGKKSFPVEVAWVFEDGRQRSYLIRPQPDWTDWSDEAEAMHGISRQCLQREGVAVETVGAAMWGELAGHQLYASAPSWDGKWLSVLLRAAGLPRHALRLKKSDEVFVEALRLALGETAAAQDIADRVRAIIDETEPTTSPHRALPDARLELERWHRARKAAGTMPE